MKLRPAPLVTAILAAALLAGGPTAAQDPTSSVSFDGVGFSFAPSIGVSANATDVPGQRRNLQTPTGPDAPHLVFSLYGERAEGGRVPPVGFTQSAVRAYRIADLEGYDRVQEQVAALQQLLAERPDPATLTTVAPAGGRTIELPFLPVPEAGQVARARVQYVDTPSLSGIAYLTGFRQDVSPLTRGDLWYTFQGISTDGAWVISATFILRTDLLPKQVSIKDINRITKNEKSWNAYLADTVATLEAASPDAFDPPLSAADDLVRSITIEGVPAREPGPLASPAPSPLVPAPAASPAPLPSASPAA